MNADYTKTILTRARTNRKKKHPIVDSVESRLTESLGIGEPTSLERKHVPQGALSVRLGYSPLTAHLCNGLSTTPFQGVRRGSVPRWATNLAEPKWCGRLILIRTKSRPHRRIGKSPVSQTGECGIIPRWGHYSEESLQAWVLAC